MLKIGRILGRCASDDVVLHLPVSLSISVTYYRRCLDPSITHSKTHTAQPQASAIASTNAHSSAPNFFPTQELDIYAITLHDPLNTPSSDTNNSFMVQLWHMEANLRGQLFHEEG